MVHICTKLALFATIFCLFHLSYVRSCGITTHTEIGHRAATHYDYIFDNNTSVADLIKKYQSAFQAGNPYPDSFYPNICKKGVFHSVSEDTHWVPFLNATINYIRKTYSTPYNEDALRLIVFTLGYVSHQMADVTWHSLGVDQGFLSAMGFVNFHGSFDAAHSVGDFGGDIVNQFELNTKYISDLGDWFIPYKDLYNIYLDFYGSEQITELDIVECSSLLFLGRLGEQLAVSLLYTDYSRKSPFLINKLNDYFLGGLDDMATWTQISWNKVFYMLENGVNACQLDHNIINIQCKQEKELLKIGEKNYSSKELRIPNEVILDHSYATFKYLKNGVLMSPSEKFIQEYSELHNKLDQLRHRKTQKNVSNSLRSNTSYFVLNDYASLGWSMSAADINNDGSDDMVVGAPVYSIVDGYQNGLVFIVLSKNGLPSKSLNLETSADLIITPPIGNNRTRFGHNIKVLDLNQDGYQDIVVSAPSYNLEEIKYQGRVYVYLGNSGLKYDTPSIIITCDNYEYCNAGWSMSVGDVNGDSKDDLIIGSPYASTIGAQCGFVSVLLSKKKDYPQKIEISNMDWLLQGNMIYEWFGFSMKAKLGYLAVSAPQSRFCHLPDCSMSNNDTQAVGRVYLYKYPSNAPIAILSGTDQFEQFGYSFDLSTQLSTKRTVIAISSYTKDTKLDRNEGALELNQAGIVQVFDITNLNNITLISVLKSDRPYSGFGSKIRFYDANNDGSEDLFLSAQLRTDSLVLAGKVEEGIVYMFKGGDKFPVGNYTDECLFTSITPCPAYKADIVFEETQDKTRFGNYIEFFRTSNTKNLQIAIASSRSDNGDSRLSGKISIFNIQNKLDLN